MFQFIKNSYAKIKGALSKTRSALSSRLSALFGKPWSEETFDQLEQILFEADLGTQCSTNFVEHLRSTLPASSRNNIAEILKIFHEKTLSILNAPHSIQAPIPATGEPYVFLIVGVNGSGKTTSIAKLAKKFQAEGKKVLLAAADTFRAAAIEQLCTWAEKLNIEIVKSIPGADPSSVAFDALSAAIARGFDVVFIDTAGRLQNKIDLMNELQKVRKVCAKVIPNAPHEILLILDATTGQNAIDQAKVFNEVTPLNGIVLSKLDGSAKGGIILSIYQQLGIPVRWVGTGEGADDIEPFDPVAYADALFPIENT